MTPSGSIYTGICCRQSCLSPRIRCMILYDIDIKDSEIRSALNGVILRVTEDGKEVGQKNQTV